MRSATCEVTNQVVGFVRKLVSTNEIVGEQTVPLPPVTLRDPRGLVDAPGRLHRRGAA